MGRCPIEKNILHLGIAADCLRIPVTKQVTGIERQCKHHPRLFFLERFHLSGLVVLEQRDGIRRQSGDKIAA
jgi:hypothetical protein